MKKKIFLSAVILLHFSNGLLAQNANNNLKKYIYYKQRFLNSFIAVGQEQGESIPFGERHKFLNQHDIAMGDGTIKLGWYMANLALEYKNLNVQNTDQTVKELWYALEAFNRLDFSAEDYLLRGVNRTDNGDYPPTTQYPGELNGFFLRDDMPIVFIDNHRWLKENSYSLVTIDTILGEFTQKENSPWKHWDANHPFEYLGVESQDQVYDLLMGLAMIKKCVPTGVTFDNLPFMDGLLDIKAEALRISDDIVKYIVAGNFKIKYPDNIPHIGGECVIAPNSRTFPDKRCNIGTGGNCDGLGYAMVNALHFITGESVNDIYGNKLFMKTYQEPVWNLMGDAAFRLSFDNFCTVAPQIVPLMPQPSPLPPPGLFMNNCPDFVTNGEHEWKFHTVLAATGGEWRITNPLAPQIIADDLGDFGLHYIATILGLTGYEDLLDLPFNTGWGHPDIFGLTNMADHRLKIFTHDWVQNEVEYLIYCFLHDVEPDWTDSDVPDFEALMNSAPCIGPYYLPNETVTLNGVNWPSVPALDWSVHDRWKNGFSTVTHQNITPGEYWGMDYMILFNLYSLLKPNYVNYNFSADNLVIPASQEYPFLFPTPTGAPWVASNTNPAVVTAFGSITGEGVNLKYYNSNLFADVTFKAPYIDIGITTDPGVRLDLIAEPVTCQLNNEYRSSGDQIIWEHGGDDHPKPLYNQILEQTGKPPLVKRYNTEKTTDNASVLKKPKELKAEDTKVNIYPNPTTSNVFIGCNAIADEKIKVLVFDVYGNLVQEGSIGNGKQGVQTGVVNITNLSDGVYIVNLKGERIDHKSKVVKASR